MLGGAPADEHFPPDDDDFDPHEYHFHGFGQAGQGPPPSPDNNGPPKPNLDHLATMGWGVWPQPANPPVDEAPPAIMPLDGNNDAQVLPEALLNAGQVEEVVQAEGPPCRICPRPRTHFGDGR